MLNPVSVIISGKEPLRFFDIIEEIIDGFVAITMSCHLNSPFVQIKLPQASGLSRKKVGLQLIVRCLRAIIIGLVAAGSVALDRSIKDLLFLMGQTPITQKP